MKRSYSLKPHQVSYGIIQGDMKRTVVSFPIEQHKQIRKLAVDTQSNFAATVRQLVTEALEARNNAKIP